MSKKSCQKTTVYGHRNQPELSETESRKILTYVREQLEASGYNPVRQIAGYLQTGDPGYITARGGARVEITKVDRYEVLAWAVENFINSES